MESMIADKLANKKYFFEDEDLCDRCELKVGFEQERHESY